MKKRLFAALLAVAAIACTACGAKSVAADTMSNAAGKDFDYFSYDAAESVASSAPALKGSATGGSVNYTVSTEAGSASAPSADQVLADRKIVKTMRITAETKAFDAAAAAIEQLCADLGGYVEASSRSGGSIRYSSSVVARSASYTLRIPADKLDAFRAGLHGDIHVVDESAQIDDITDQYFDVDTRIATLKIEEERLLAMLEKATELEYLITLEQRLSEVRYEIESYTGTLRRYDSQVAYSTVRLTLDEVMEYTEIIEAPQTFGQRLAVAFRESWTDFGDGCKDFAVWFVYALPTLLVLAVIGIVSIGGILLLVRRANRQRRDQQ